MLLPSQCSIQGFYYTSEMDLGALGWQLKGGVGFLNYQASSTNLAQHRKGKSVFELECEHQTCDHHRLPTLWNGTRRWSSRAFLRLVSIWWGKCSFIKVITLYNNDVGRAWQLLATRLVDDMCAHLVGLRIANVFDCSCSRMTGVRVTSVCHVVPCHVVHVDMISKKHR